MSFALVLLVLLVGGAVGLLSAMFGVGGGVIMVPFIVLVLEQSQHVAEGTSLLVIVPTAAIGVLAHRKRGFVDFRMAAGLAWTGVIGSVVGAKLALSLPPERLQSGFGIFTIIVGGKFLVDGLRKRRSAA